MLLHDTFLDLKYNKEDPYLSTSLFCHPPRSIFNTNNNPICETSMFLISQSYKCKIFFTFSEYPFLTPLKFHHGWLYSTIFPRQIFLCLKNSKTLITLREIGISRQNQVAISIHQLHITISKTI